MGFFKRLFNRDKGFRRATKPLEFDHKGLWKPELKTPKIEVKTIVTEHGNYVLFEAGEGGLSGTVDQNTLTLSHDKQRRFVDWTNQGPNLLKVIDQYASGKGIKEVVLEVDEHGQSFLYEKLGYKRVGTERRQGLVFLYKKTY